MQEELSKSITPDEETNMMTRADAAYQMCLVAAVRSGYDLYVSGVIYSKDNVSGVVGRSRLILLVV